MIGARATLRRRVTIGFTVLGALLCLLFTGATVFISEDYEHILVDEILRGQAEDYSLRLTANPDATLPQTHRLSGYLRKPDGSGVVPPEVRDLAPGIHETDEEESGLHIGVFDTPSGRLYFMIDLSDIEQLERHLTGFLIAVIVLGTCLSGWLGWLLAGATIAPVRRLSAAVEALTTQAQRTDLAASLAPDELGKLAEAIDRYQSRLVDAAAAERSFFADASHELRTPVSVVRGAVELLLDDPPSDAATLRRLLRLDRGVRELTELLEVLLGLVRGHELQIGGVDAGSFLRTCTEVWMRSSGPKNLWIDVDAEGTLIVPEREAMLVLKGVVRRLVPPDAAGRLSLSLHDEKLELEFRIDASVPQDVMAIGRSDRGLGLMLIGRLAEKLGWRIEEYDSGPGQRRALVILPGSVLRS